MSRRHERSRRGTERNRESQTAPARRRAAQTPRTTTRALARELLLPCGTLFVALPPPGRQSRGEGGHDPSTSLRAGCQSRRASARLRVHPARQIPARVFGTSESSSPSALALTGGWMIVETI